ncbi:hypothetical protein Zmor_016332 [Zophobas morio]|uniref:Mitochondrial 2-oxoglutarate/malate carrier protein n=1 Tax=Zophobas morio TaxID=2755281 RepID=A0AA38LZH7_9CUCU|nr:hypothetical protein Zmor_016332 [Zophobas morio]
MSSSAVTTNSSEKCPTSVSFFTAGLGGVVEGGPRPNLERFTSSIIKEEGIFSLYSGLTAGITRQIFYATSRFGLYEVFRDALSRYRDIDFVSRVMTGVASGACAALISCPAEVALVRMSNDSSLPSGDQRKYRHIIDCATRIWREEGVRTFWRGSLPFVNRAMVVGVCQVGTYDQFLSIFSKLGFFLSSKNFSLEFVRYTHRPITSFEWATGAFNFKKANDAVFFNVEIDVEKVFGLRMPSRPVMQAARFDDPARPSRRARSQLFSVRVGDKLTQQKCLCLTRGCP